MEIYLGQRWPGQWLVAWLCQAIQGTNVDLSSEVKSSDIHVKAFSQEIPQPSVTEITLKITYLRQAGKLKFFGACPNWVVSYIAYTKFHSPRPVFHLPDQIFTRIGERASASVPACMIPSKSPRGQWVKQGVQQSGKSQGNSRLGKSQGKVREFCWRSGKKMNTGKSQGKVREFAFSAI